MNFYNRFGYFERKKITVQVKQPNVLQIFSIFQIGLEKGITFIFMKNIDITWARSGGFRNQETAIDQTKRKRDSKQFRTISSTGQSILPLFRPDIYLRRRHAAGRQPHRGPAQLLREQR